MKTKQSEALKKAYEQNISNNMTYLTVSRALLMIEARKFTSIKEGMPSKMKWQK